MKAISSILVSGLLLAPMPALADESTVREFGDSRMMEITVNGRVTQVEVAPDAPDAPVVIAEVASELGLKGSMVAGLHRIGSTKLWAKSNVVRIGFNGDKPVKRRMFWFDNSWTDIGEGRIGPATLPEDVITFRLTPTMAGEQTIILPLIDRGFGGVVTTLIAGGNEISAQFSLDRGETMVTASTGAMLAESFSGRRVGEARIMPIEFKISRPVQPMAFDQPVMLGDLPLVNFVVRTQDTGSITGIPAEGGDEDEIVVTADSKKKPKPRILVGLDSLKGCSTLTFDKAAKEIRLSCSPR